MSANQVKASHILVKNIKKAQELIQNIQQGKSFENLAKKHSQCPSGKKGGDLGFFRRGQMVKEFDEAVFSNPVGKVVGPVKTHFGYHIIKVTDKK